MRSVLFNPEFPRPRLTYGRGRARLSNHVVGFPKPLSCRGRFVVPRAANPVPRPAATFTKQSPADGPQRCTAFARQGVCAQAPIPESECCASRSSVEKRTCVPCAVRTQPRHFQSRAIISQSRNWAPHNGNANKRTASDGTQRKLVPHHGLVVAVENFNEGVRLCERDIVKGQPHAAVLPALRRSRASVRPEVPNTSGRSS